jgi:hypothetical protein
MLFYTLCVLAFLGGLFLIELCFPPAITRPQALSLRVNPALFLLAPLSIGIAGTLWSMSLLLQNNPRLFDLLLANKGFQIKENVDIHQPLGLASTYLLGITWWAMWRAQQVELKRWSKRLLWLTVFVALITVILSAFLRLSRGEVIPAIVGSGVIYCLSRNAAGNLSRKTYKRILISAPALLIGAFACFASVRGSDTAMSDMLLYTLPSYNRLAALVNGHLIYPYAGSGVYLSPFLSFNTTVNAIVPVADIMHWGSFDNVWQSEFTATSLAGLDGALIWSGTFGYIFADLGWFAPLLLLGYGLLFGQCWRSCKLGRTAGIVLYPRLCAFILLWFTTNDIFDTRTVVLVVVAVVLSIYERLTLSRGQGRGVTMMTAFGRPVARRVPLATN